MSHCLSVKALTIDGMLGLGPAASSYADTKPDPQNPNTQTSSSTQTHSARSKTLWQSMRSLVTVVACVIALYSSTITNASATLLLDTTFNPSFYGIDYRSYDSDRVMAIQSDGKIVIAADVTTSAFSGLRLFRLNADGTMDTTFNSSFDAPSIFLNIFSIVVQEDDKIVLAVTLPSSFGLSERYVVRLNADGSDDPTFIEHTFGGTVISRFGLALQADGKILVNYKGDGITTLIRLNADGAIDSSFENDPEAGGIAAGEVMALQGDGKILLGNLAQLKRLNADGSLDPSFTMRLSPETCSTSTAECPMSISAMAIQTDGKIVIAGSFFAVGGVPKAGLLRFNTDGTEDSSFRPTSLGGSAYSAGSLIIQSDGRILVYAGGSSIQHIVRLNSDGSISDDSIDATFGIAALNTWILLLQTDGNILFGSGRIGIGAHVTFTSSDRALIVRLLNTYPDFARQNLSATYSSVTWSRGGTAPEVSSVTFEQSSDGIHYTFLGHGSRIGSTSNWQLTGLDLPLNTYVRARGLYLVGGSNRGRTSGSVVGSSVGRVSRMLCGDPRRAWLPCRSIAVRVLRYLRPGPLRAAELVEVNDATVRIMGPKDEMQKIVADETGGYPFEEAIVGQAYQFDIWHKELQFKPETVKITEDTNELIFVAQEDKF